MWCHGVRWVFRGEVFFSSGLPPKGATNEPFPPRLHEGARCARALPTAPSVTTMSGLRGLLEAFSGILQQVPTAYYSCVAREERTGGGWGNSLRIGSPPTHRARPPRACLCATTASPFHAAATLTRSHLATAGGRGYTATHQRTSSSRQRSSWPCCTSCWSSAHTTPPSGETQAGGWSGALRDESACALLNPPWRPAVRACAPARCTTPRPHARTPSPTAAMALAAQ